MEIAGRKIGDIDVLVLKGRLDASSSRLVKESMSELVKDKRVKIVIDLADIDFIDSSGLGSLVAALRSVNKMEGDIKIASLQAPVRAIFELTRLHKIFEIFDDASSAAKSF